MKSILVTIFLNLVAGFNILISIFFCIFIQKKYWKFEVYLRVSFRRKLHNLLKLAMTNLSGKPLLRCEIDTSDHHMIRSRLSNYIEWLRCLCRQRRVGATKHSHYQNIDLSIFFTNFYDHSILYGNVNVRTFFVIPLLVSGFDGWRQWESGVMENCVRWRIPWSNYRPACVLKILKYILRISLTTVYFNVIGRRMQTV